MEVKKEDKSVCDFLLNYCVMYLYAYALIVGTM